MSAIQYTVMRRFDLHMQAELWKGDCTGLQDSKETEVNSVNSEHVHAKKIMTSHR